VRRIPDLSAEAANAGPDQLFDSWRFHALFTTSSPDTMTADKTHRQHAVIEQVQADLKNSALAHLPSCVFAANAAWLVLAVMAFNLTRPPAPSPGPGKGDYRHGPPAARARPSSDRLLGPAAGPAATDRLALADRLDRTVHPRLRATHRRAALTTSAQLGGRLVVVDLADVDLRRTLRAV